jgi:acyl-CoA synthetase (AMP-forming)/AMP-acid ligase II
MNQFLIRILGVMIAGIVMTPVHANATSTASTKTKATSKASKPAPVKDEDEAEPDIQSSKNAEYKCELGNSLTMYTNPDDPHHIAMRWKKHLYRLTRVETTTGANRFENQKAGFVWIGIPTKSLLLDSRRGQQLANECQTTEPVLADAKPEAAAEQTK